MSAVDALKARGAFYTPPDLASYLADWAIRTAHDKVLEPSCGEAAFVRAAWERLRTLDRIADPTRLPAIVCYELDPIASQTARSVVAGLGANAAIETKDFFDVVPGEAVDAVIGNPPYVRYQSFSGYSRVKAQRAAFAAGVRLDGLASSWAAFVVHACRFLKQDGRLALVLPAELLHVRYAFPVRRYLMQRFSKVTLVTFEKLVFPGVTSEVVLLLAEGSGGSDSIELRQVEDLDGLANHRITRRHWAPHTEDTKWSAALIAGEPLDLYKGSLADGSFVPLADWGDSYLCAVTGNNAYFRMTRSRALALGLESGDVVDVLPPRAKRLCGLSYSPDAHRELQMRDAPAVLFCPAPGAPSEAARRYIEAGEGQGVHLAYKCRVRNPWWRVPLPRVADAFITYMSHDSPRLISNTAGVHALNSVHGLICHRERVLGRELLPLAAMNSITALGAEMVGRSYGGGVLKLEPREAARLPVPSPELVRSHAAELRDLRASAERLLRSERYGELREQVDSVVLGPASNEHPGAIRAARDVLRSRRLKRSRSS